MSFIAVQLHAKINAVKLESQEENSKKKNPTFKPVLLNGFESNDQVNTSKIFFTVWAHHNRSDGVNQKTPLF